MLSNLILLGKDFSDFFLCLYEILIFIFLKVFKILSLVIIRLVNEILILIF